LSSDRFDDPLGGQILCVTIGSKRRPGRLVHLLKRIYGIGLAEVCHQQSN
jgi:hypothetical protein